MKHEERKYYENLIINNRNDLRKTWNVIKEVINKSKSDRQIKQFKHNNSVVTDNREIASHFNDFFVNIGPTLASKIPGPLPNFRDYMPQINPHSLFLSPVNEIEVKNIVRSLKNGAPGWDDITMKSLNCIINHLSEALSYICNLSLTDGVFPTEMKLTKIVPIYKSNDPMEFTNYRPISLLSIFSKILESVMYKRLIKFINKYNLLYKYQLVLEKNILLSCH